MDNPAEQQKQIGSPSFRGMDELFRKMVASIRAGNLLWLIQISSAFPLKDGEPNKFQHHTRDERITLCTDIIYYVPFILIYPKSRSSTNETHAHQARLFVHTNSPIASSIRSYR